MFRNITLATALVSSLLGCNSKQDTGTTGAATPGLEEAVSTATDAYIYGYPLVTMDMTRRKITNVSALQGMSGPMGQVIMARTYPPASYHDVTAPNADTLYTIAWLDLSKEPWIFSIPDMGDRYFLMPMLDGWTDVFQVPGKRTTGDKAQKYALTGPGWSGALPAGVTEYKSQPQWYGYWDASIARGLHRTTRLSTRCRTSSRWCLSVPMASRTRRRRVRWIQILT
nr:DUF1254 domain-containing protein [Granulicella sp. L46]